MPCVMAKSPTTKCHLMNTVTDTVPGSMALGSHSSHPDRRPHRVSVREHEGFAKQERTSKGDKRGDPEQRNGKRKVCGLYRATRTHSSILQYAPVYGISERHTPHQERGRGRLTLPELCPADRPGSTHIMFIHSLLIAAATLLLEMEILRHGMLLTR